MSSETSKMTSEFSSISGNDGDQIVLESHQHLNSSILTDQPSTLNVSSSSKVIKIEEKEVEGNEDDDDDSSSSSSSSSSILTTDDDEDTSDDDDDDDENVEGRGRSETSTFNNHLASSSLLVTPEIESAGGPTGSLVAPLAQVSTATSQASNLDYLLSVLPPGDMSGLVSPFDEPIVIRGNGSLTLFGLSNSFTSAFPSSLLGRVSREEFEFTMGRINHLLASQHATNAKLLVLGCLCCCFSLGCSLLWPTFALSKRTRHSLLKLLSMENDRLYHRLGLNWRLSKQQCHTNHAFVEYILVIDFLPKVHIYQPD